MADEGDAADPIPARMSSADRAVDVVVALVVVVTAALWFRLTAGTWFFLDEWALAGRGRTPADFFEPYNGHLSVTYIAVYRAHMELFGFGGYTVLRVLGIVALASGPVLLYATTRRPLGAMPAAVASLAVLWSQGVSLEPGAMNHSAVVACTVLAAWAARSSTRRSDGWVAGSLTLGFLTAGGMVATAAGLVVQSGLERSSRRRWLAVLVPTAAWAAWYLLQDRPPTPEEHRIDLVDALTLPFRGTWATLEGLAGGNAIAGVLLAVLVGAVAVRQVRVHGRPAVTSLVTWAVASAVWWLGLAQSRQALADPETYRYRLLAAVFLVLALVPTGPDTVPLDAGLRLRRWATVVPAAVVASAALVLAAVNLGVARDAASTLEAHGAAARRQSLVAFADPAVVDLGDEPIAGLGSQLQADLVELRDLYGPPGVPAATLDAELVRGGAVDVRPMPAPDGVACTPAAELEGPPGEVVLRAGPEPVELFVRRYGDEPVLVTTLPAGSTRVVATSPLLGDEPWVVLADGACAFVP